VRPSPPKRKAATDMRNLHPLRLLEQIPLALFAGMSQTPAQNKTWVNHFTCNILTASQNLRLSVVREDIEVTSSDLGCKFPGGCNYDAYDRCAECKLDLCKSHFESGHNCNQCPIMPPKHQHSESTASQSADARNKRKRSTQRSKSKRNARRHLQNGAEDSDFDDEDEGNYKRVAEATSKHTRSSRPLRAAAMTAIAKNAEMLQGGVDYHASPDLLYGSQVHR